MNSISRYIRLAFGRSNPINDSQRRYVRVLQASTTSLGGKGLALILNIISVPLTITYLGPERYGLWVTLSTLGIWLSLLDLGLGNQMTSQLAAVCRNEDQIAAKRVVATTFWTLIGVSFVCCVVLIPVSLSIDWATLLNLRTESLALEFRSSMLLILIIFFVQSPLLVASKILGAYQEGAYANLWNTAANVMSFAGVIVVSLLRGEIIWLVLAMMGLPLVVNGISTIWLFSSHKPVLKPKLAYFDRTIWRQAFTGGITFFALQIAGLVLYQTDNIIIAKYLGTESVSTYSVAYRLFSYVGIIHALVLTPLWPAYSEAYAMRDWKWITKTLTKTLKLGMTTVIVIVGILIFTGGFIINRWTNNLLHAELSLLILLGLWTILGAWGYTFSYLLNGLEHIKLQTIAAWLMAGLNLGLSIFWVQLIGIDGVILATVVSYAVTSAWIQPLDAILFIRRQRLDSATPLR